MSATTRADRPVLAPAVVLALGVLTTLLGCTSSISVKPSQPAPFTQQPVEDLRGVESLSRETQQLLRVYELDRKLPDYPTAVVAVLEGLSGSRLARPALAAEAEVALLAAHNVADRVPTEAAEWCLLSASRAWEFLFEGDASPIERAMDPRFQRMRLVYNRAVGSYVGLLGATASGLEEHERASRFELFDIQVGIGSNRLEFEKVDRLLVARDLEVRGLRNRYRRDGIGAALVAYRENRRDSPTDRFYAMEGFVDPVTAVMRFGPRVSDGARSVTLSLYDPRRSATISVGELEVPLQADFTTHLAYLVSLADVRALGWRAALNPERFGDLTGLFLLERYDPVRIPIVMVHGLRSTPLAWMELSNDILGDPELRSRYQIWHFFYPTALPYLYVGRVLRAKLQEIRVELDPDGDDPAMQSMVFVAHSMGGLITRTLVCDSGQNLWQAAFTVPPDQIRGRPQDVDFLRNSLIFSHEVFIDRVVFISTPHRGADRATGLLGHLGASLIEVPDYLSERMERLWELNREVMTPAMVDLTRKGTPDAIEAIRPDNVMLQALGRLPIAPGIPYHTILGNRGRDDVLPVSDGWVTYDSVHLQGAQSELLVPAGHAAYAHPGAIAEIMRILSRHLRELDAPSM